MVITIINCNIITAHCRDNYLREFAYKTLPGIDRPNKEGQLLELRRLRLKPITSSKKLCQDVLTYSKRPGEYVSVYSFERLVKKGDKHAHNGTEYKEYQIGKAVYYESAKINRIYLDFDAEDNPQTALSEALLVARELFKRGIVVHCYFSGKKGIAMYIEFKVLDLREEIKHTVLTEFFTTIIKEMISSLNYENFNGMTYPLINPEFKYELLTLDTTTKGDIARVSRIPNTMHASGLYCIPLTYGDMYRGIEYIKELAKAPRYDIDLEDTITKNMIRNTPIMHTILKNIEKKIIADKEHKKIIDQIKKWRADHFKHQTINSGALTPEQVQAAKEIPIGQVIGMTGERTKCELHGGDNPTSLQIYPHSNTFYCHVCKRGGDTIKFIEYRDRVDFKTAVRQLVGA